MKRHPALVPFSRDHRDGFLLATRLQQDERALLRLWSHNPRWQAGYVLRFCDEHLTKHFREEEDILCPAIKRYIREHEKTLEQLLGGHTTIRALVRRFRNPAAAHLRQRLINFGKVLEDHIHCEERKLLPLCEKPDPEPAERN